MKPSSSDAHASFLAAFQAGIVEASAPEIGKVYDELDAHIRRATSVLPPLACKKGCCACCFTSPPVTSLEWKHLFDHLHTMPAASLSAIIEAAERVRPLIPDLLALHEALEREEPPFTVSIQCPFLIDGACSVYTARPL